MMEHLQEESNCSTSVGFDLYSDILTEDVKHREHTFDELQNKFEEVQKKIASLENELATQQTLVQEYSKKNFTLQSNISSLFMTAKRELCRKDSEIKELRNSTPRRHWNGTRPPVTEFSIHGEKGTRSNPDSEANAAIFSSQTNKPQACEDAASPISYRLRVLSQEVCKTDLILSSSPCSRENRSYRRENRSKDSGKDHTHNRTPRTDEFNEVCDSFSSGRLKSRVKRRLSDEDIQDRSKRFRHESARDAKYDCARKLVERSKKDITRRRESVERSLSSIRANIQRTGELEQENKHKTRNSDTDSDRHYHWKEDRVSGRDRDKKIRRDDSKFRKVQTHLESHRKSDRSPERGPSKVVDLREKLRLASQQKEVVVENTDRDTKKTLVQTPDKDLRGRNHKSDANELSDTNKTFVEKSKLSGDCVTVKRNSRQNDDRQLRTTRNCNSSEVDTVISYAEELIDNSEQYDDNIKVSVTCKVYNGKRLRDVLSSQFENANKSDSLNNTRECVISEQLVNVEKDSAARTACKNHIIHQKEKDFSDSHKDAQNVKGAEIHGSKTLQLEFNPNLESIRESLKEACFSSDHASTDNTGEAIGEEHKNVEQLLVMNSESVNNKEIMIRLHEISNTSDQENKESTDLINKENKDTTYSNKDNKNTTYSIKENKGITDSGKEKKCSTDSLKHNKERSDSGRKNKDKTDRENLNKTDSNKDHKDKTDSSNGKQNKTEKKLSTKDFFRNVGAASPEQQSDKKGQAEKPLNNKEHGQDREQFSASTTKKEKASISGERVKELDDAKSETAAKLDQSEQTCGGSKEKHQTVAQCKDTARECQPLDNNSSKIDKASRGRHDLGKDVPSDVQDVTSMASENLNNKNTNSAKETWQKKKKKNVVQELERRTSTRKKPANVENYIMNSADVNVECNNGKLSKDRIKSPDNCAESVELNISVRNTEKCFETQEKEIKKIDIREKSAEKKGKDRKEEKEDSRCKNKEKGGKSLKTYVECRKGGDYVEKKKANRKTLKDDKDVRLMSTKSEDPSFNGNSNTLVCSNKTNLVENSAFISQSPLKGRASADNSVVSEAVIITQMISVVSSSDTHQREILEESEVQKSKSNGGYTFSPELSESDKTDRILSGCSTPGNWGSQRCFVTSETEYEFDSDNQSPHQGIYTYSPGSRYNRQLSVNRSGTTPRNLVSSKPSCFAKIYSSETDVAKSDRNDSGQSGEKSEVNSQETVISEDVESSHSVDLIDYVSKQIEVEISKAPVKSLPILPIQSKRNRNCVISSFASIDSAKRPDFSRKIQKPSSNNTNQYEEVVFDHTAVASMEGYFPTNPDESAKNSYPSKDEEKPNTEKADGKTCEKSTEQKLTTNAGKRSVDNTRNNHSSVNKSTNKTCTKTSTALPLKKPDAKASESESLLHKSTGYKTKQMEDTQTCSPHKSSTQLLQSSIELEKRSEKTNEFERPRETSTLQISPVMNSYPADNSMESPHFSVSRTSNISQISSNRSGLLRDLLGEVSQEIFYLESSKKKKARKEISIENSEERRLSDSLLSIGKRDKASSSLNSSCDCSCFSASTSLDESQSPDKSSGTNLVSEPSESISRISGLTFLFEDLDDTADLNKTTSHEQFQLEKEGEVDGKSMKEENTKKNSSPSMSSFQPENGSCSETIRRDLEACLFGNMSSSSEDSQFSQKTDMKCEQENEGFSKVDKNPGASGSEIIDTNLFDQCNSGINLSKFNSEENNMIMSTSREDSSFDIYASISNTSTSLLKVNPYIIEDEMLTFDIPDQSQSDAVHHAMSLFSDGPEGDKSSAVEFPSSERVFAGQIRDDSSLNRRNVTLEEHLMETIMEESPGKGGSILQQKVEGSQNNNVVKDFSVKRRILLSPSPVKQHKSVASHHQLVTEDFSAKFEKSSSRPNRQQKSDDNKIQNIEYPFLMTISSRSVSPVKPCAQSSEKQCIPLNIKSPMKPNNSSIDCLPRVRSPKKHNSPAIENIIVKNFNVLPGSGSAQLIVLPKNSENVTIHSHIDIISPGKNSSAKCNLSVKRENTCSNDKSISEHSGIKLHSDVRNEDRVVMPSNGLVQQSQTLGTVMQSLINGDISSSPEKSSDEYTPRKHNSADTCPGKSREYIKTATGDKFSKNGHPVIVRKSHQRHNPSPSKSATSLIKAINNTSVKPSTPGEFDSERGTKAKSSRMTEKKTVIVSDVLHMQKNHSPVKVCHMSFQNKEMIESTQCFLVKNSESKTEPDMPSSEEESKKSNRKQSSAENYVEKIEQCCRNESHTKSNEGSRSPRGKILSTNTLEGTENSRHSVDKPATSFPQVLVNISKDICESQVEVYTENKLRSRSKTVYSESQNKRKTCTMENRSEGHDKTFTNAKIFTQDPHTSSPHRKRKESVVIFGNELSLHAPEDLLLNLVDPAKEKMQHEKYSKMRLSKQADKGPNTESVPDIVSKKGPTVRGKKSSKESPEMENNSGKTFIKRRKSNSKKDSQISLTSPWKELRRSPRRSQIQLSPQLCRDKVVGISSARKRILHSPDKFSDSKRARISLKKKDSLAEKPADNTVASISPKKKSNLPKNASYAKKLKNSPQSGNVGIKLETSDQFSEGRSKVSSYKKSDKISTSLTAGMQCRTSPRIKKTKLLEQVFKSEDSRSPRKNLPPKNKKSENARENNEFCAARDNKDAENKIRSGLQESSRKKKLAPNSFAELTKKDESPQPKREIPVPVITEVISTNVSQQIPILQANLEQVKSADLMPRKTSVPVTEKGDKNTEMEDQITASQIQPLPSRTVKEHQELLEPAKKKRKLERCSIMACNIFPDEVETEHTNNERTFTKNTIYVEINYNEDAEKLDKIVLRREIDSKYDKNQLETRSRAEKMESSKERTVDSRRNRHIGPDSLDRVENYMYDSGGRGENEAGMKTDRVKVLLSEEKLVVGEEERTDVEDDWDSSGDENVKKDDVQHKEKNDSDETDEKNTPDTFAVKRESDNDYYNDFDDDEESERVNLGEGKELCGDRYDDNSDEEDDLEEGEIGLDSDDFLFEALQPDKDTCADGSEITSEVKLPRKIQETQQNSLSNGDLAREERERKKLLHQSLFLNKGSYQRSKWERKDTHLNRRQESVLADKRLKSSLRSTKSERKNSQRRSKSLSKSRSPKQRLSVSKSKSPSCGKQNSQRRSRSKSRSPQRRLSVSSKSKSSSSEVLDRHSLSSRSRSKDRHLSKERLRLGSQKEHISPRSGGSRRHRSRDSPRWRVLTPEKQTPRWRKSKEILSSRGKSPVRFSGSSRRKLSPHEHSRRACESRRRR